MHRKRRPSFSLAIAAAALHLAPAQASGYIPMPDMHETLPNFRACLARLEAAYAEDRNAEKPRTFEDDGGYSEVGLETRTKGVEHTGRNKARYHGRLWFAHGRITSHDATQREVSHSWREQELLCEGRKLTVKGSQGYTLSTFEPINSAVPVEPATEGQWAPPAQV